MIHESLKARKIIHFDMDAFYAAVETRDNPSLQGKPLVIGGSPNSRSVVCTASYEARKFGIRSAMPCSQAYRLCPQAIFLKPNFDKYRQASQKIRSIFEDYTHQIEPLSLDEAYLDVSNDPKGRYATQIAKEIQARVFKELGLTGSAGVAPNKMIAKIASDYRKPFGITVIQPHEVMAFLEPLKLRSIPGVGPASQRRLESLGFSLCRDLWAETEESLQEKLGESMGSWLYWRSRGIDERPVQSSRERKSLGLERTFSLDIHAIERIQEILKEQIKQLQNELKDRSLWAKTWTLKVKYHDFKQCTRSQSLDEQISSLEGQLDCIFLRLLDKTEAGKIPIRLLGVSASKLLNHTPNCQNSNILPFPSTV